MQDQTEPALIRSQTYHLQAVVGTDSERSRQDSGQGYHLPQGQDSERSRFATRNPITALSGIHHSSLIDVRAARSPVWLVADGLDR